MDLDLERSRASLQPPSLLAVILLDTNAVLWLHSGHRRARPLLAEGGSLYMSPASLLELQFLVEAGRLRLRAGARVGDLAEDDRWALDDPPAVTWFSRALELAWTRDPFDRLLVAHARFRGWRIATGDGVLLDRLGSAETLEL
jgi:PIN domain nuclease of toxin-antitoxin system